MAKNRYISRSSYDNRFKYGDSEISSKAYRNTTYEQTEFMKNLYSNKFLTSWEKEFIRSVLKENVLSEKQIEVLKTIHRKKSKLQ